MHEPQIDDDEFLFEPHRSFVVDLCRAIGLNTCGLVSFRLPAGEDDTHIPRIRAEYVLGHEFGQPAQKVLHEYSLVATPISSQEVGTVDRSVSLSTLFETIHRVVESPAPARTDSEMVVARGAEDEYLVRAARRVNTNASLRRDAGAFAHMAATEVSEALASATQKKLVEQVSQLKASLEAEWEARGVDMTTLYHPAYGGIVRPKSLAFDCLGMLASECDGTADPQSQSPGTNRESPRASACPSGCCARTSGPDRSIHTQSSTSAERGSVSR